MRRSLLILPLLLVAGSCGPSDSFRRFEDEYWRKWLKANPSAATGSGIHDYDGMLEDYSAAAIQAREADLAGMLERLQWMSGLSEEQASDAEILRSAIRAELLETRELRS